MILLQNIKKISFSLRNYFQLTRYKHIKSNTTSVTLSPSFLDTKNYNRNFSNANDSRSYSSTKELPSIAEVVVIGGGVVGTSTAFHLAKRGVNVALVERHKLTCGTTWHSAAMINTLRSSVNESKLMRHTRNVITTIEDETGVSPGWIKHGGLTITKNIKFLDELRRMCTLSKYVKNESRMVSPEDIKEIHPLLNTDEILGGLYVPADGSVDPTGLTNAYARGAKQNGATIIEDFPINEIVIDQDRKGNKRIKAVKSEKGYINCDKVILAAGAWSKMVADTIGITLPIKVIKHNYLVTDIIPGMSKLPNVRYADGSVYLKVHNDTLFLGTFERNPTFVENLEPDLVFGLYDLDWDVFQPCLDHMIDIMPKLAEVGYRSIINGPESFTPDYMPLFGSVPEVEGLFLNCAMNSRGIQLSGGVGKEMANLIVDGVTSVDMSGYNITRFQDSYVRNKKWLDERTHEAILRTYVAKAPTIQPLSSRNLRKSPLHEFNERSGAFFGVAGGWERPMFYIPDVGDGVKVPAEYDWYGYYGHPKRADTSMYEKIHDNEYANWSYSKRVSGLIRREVEHCRNECSIFDLTSFGKIRVKGKDALKTMEWLCTAKMDKPLLHTTYTLTLNDKGGIENDFTVTRLNNDEFFLVTGASVTKHVLSLLTTLIRTREESCDLHISDETENYAMISVQGPKSRQVLSSLLSSQNKDALSNENFPFSTAKKLSLNLNGDVVDDALAIRITFVGELGYELYVSNTVCEKLTKCLVDNNEGVKVKMAGMEALSSMSMEKGYRHWHGDIETTDSPIEAGLKFLCKSSSGISFKGKTALDNIANHPIKRRLLGFAVDDSSIDLNGGEVIYKNGSCIVGYIKRSGFGYTINKHIGYGYIEIDEPDRGHSAKDTLSKLMKSSYELEVMGKRVKAEPFHKALYDCERHKILS